MRGFASTILAMSSSWCAGSERSRRSTPSSSAKDWCVRPPTKRTASARRAVSTARSASSFASARGRRGQLARAHAGGVLLAALPALRLPVALREDDVGPASDAREDALEGRDLAERLHARRVAARGEAAHGVVADDRDRLQLREVERQDGRLVLQEDDRLLRDAAGRVEVLLRVDRGRPAAVEAARRDQHAQVAAHLVVERRHRERAVLQPGEERAGEEVLVVGPAGAHLEVEAIEDRLARVVRAAPVGDDGALEAPLALEHLVQQVIVVAGVLAAELVVGAHHGEGPALAHARLERGQVDLAQRPLVDLHVDRAAVLLLVVEGVVLDAGDRLLGLHALHVADGHPAGEPGVLAEVVVVAAAERSALDVERRGRGSRACRARGPRRRPYGRRAPPAPGSRSRPGRCRPASRSRSRSSSRRAPRSRRWISSRTPCGPSAVHRRRHAEPLDAARAELAVRVDEPDLLLERQAAEQVLDARVDRLRGVEVGRALVGEDRDARADRNGGGRGRASAPRARPARPKRPAVLVVNGVMLSLAIGSSAVVPTRGLRAARRHSVARAGRGQTAVRRRRGSRGGRCALNRSRTLPPTATRGGARARTNCAGRSKG